MRRRQWLAALLLLLGCGPQELVVVMHSQNNSGQSGYATITDLGGKIRVLVVVHQADVPDPQPVHFHPGRCGEIGAKLVPPGGLGLPDLQPGGPPDDTDPPPPSDGGIAFTRATLEVKFKDVTGGDYVLNVHDSRDFALYVSCGNIN